MTAGLALLANVWLYREHSERAASRLVARFVGSSASLQNPSSKLASPAPAASGNTAQPLSCEGPAPSSRPLEGQASMLVEIPSLGETAPVLPGTNESVLSQAIGHLDSSAWPDQGGTDVLEAHDVTFLRSIGDLKDGQQVDLVGRCKTWIYQVSTHFIAREGEPIIASAPSSVVLVTCWPTDALYYTNQRYVVEAALVSSVATSPVLLASTSAAPQVQPALPDELKGASLNATKVGIPLGRLEFKGSFSPGWLKSPRPLQASDAATNLLEAAVVATRAHNDAWLQVIAPNLPPSELQTLGVPLKWTAPVNVVLFGEGTQVTGASMTASVNIAGRDATMTLTTTVGPTGMVISAFTLS
ncbi:MAG TPA: class D sortase [Acidimicrobiales bacterium]